VTTDSSPDNVLAGSVTMMIEPTESKSKAELDRFCDALISIYRGIRAIETGEADIEDYVLKCAPHTAQGLAGGLLGPELLA